MCVRNNREQKISKNQKGIIIIITKKINKWKEKKVNNNKKITRKIAIDFSYSQDNNKKGITK